MAHGDPNKRRRSGQPLCFSPGPAPRTARGKRRHAARSQAEQQHANAAHAPRDDYFAYLGSQFAGRIKAPARL